MRGSMRTRMNISSSNCKASTRTDDKIRNAVARAYSNAHASRDVKHKFAGGRDSIAIPTSAYVHFTY